MTKIGILSDTHGYLDPRVLEHFAEVDEIWHAGDIGSLELADEIAQFKPLRAVYGNIDNSAVRSVYDEEAWFCCEDVSVVMTHIGGYPRHYEPKALRRIQSARPKIFISGHSHILKVMYDPVYDLLHINPGAAGLQGWHKERTLVRLTIEGNKFTDCEVITIK